MSWMQTLYETHKPLSCLPVTEGETGTCVPESHSTARAHIEIVLDTVGQCSRASIIDKTDATTVIPCTEASATRSGKKPVPHPLCDGLQYLAADFRKYGGVVTSGFAKEDDQPHKDYMEQLRKWVAASPHPKTVRILKYLEGGTVIADLVRQHVLPLDVGGKIASSKTSETAECPIWAVLPAGQPADKAVVRWRVEIPGDLASGVWEDQSLLDNWSAYYPATIETKGLCMVNGDVVALSSLHPAKLRHAGDKAKLISSDDSSGFTFRGRFTDGTQACGVGYEVSQKAHSALRWLIARQGYRNDTQVFVSWAVSGKPTPPPIEDSHDWLDEPIDMGQGDAQAGPDHTRDAGQSFALRLNKYIAGYAATFDPTECIVVMGLDSATPGRMSIIYYRELLGSEFLERLKKWHADMAWPQRVSAKQKGKGKKKGAPVAPWRACAPTPRNIAEAAYGLRLDAKLKRATVERLVPCIVDGREPPADLVESCVRRAANRPGFKDKEQWEWEQALGVACAMYKGRHARHAKAEQRRTYDMALEPERTSRDYLYGRLLAVAEHIEEVALRVAGEDRPTTAARLMQRFADHPCSTWRTIEMALQPYMQRLQASRGGFLHNMRTLLDEVLCLFQGEDFQSEHRLTGEFLLGYHCQRQIWKKDRSNAAETEGEE